MFRSLNVNSSPTVVVGKVKLELINLILELDFSFD